MNREKLIYAKISIQFEVEGAKILKRDRIRIHFLINSRSLSKAFLNFFKIFTYCYENLENVRNFQRSIEIFAKDLVSKTKEIGRKDFHSHKKNSNDPNESQIPN